MASPLPPNTVPGSGIPNNNAGVNPPLPGDTFQPTVRVMRLYKPGFHLTQCNPALPVGNSYINEIANITPPTAFDGCVYGIESNLSSFLLLPDSFGDIYLGEKFSAYIAIVNGFAQVPFYNVTLSIRLQTASTVLDLQDTVPSNNKNAIINASNSSVTFPMLGYNDSGDVIVSQVLNELGTHTLRVSVQYSLLPGTNHEVKTLRKFYRFNVLQPLSVLSSFREVNHKPMIQCQVTNSTKSPIFIEEMKFVPLNKNAEIVQLEHPSFTKLTNTKEQLFANDLLLLQPEESYAFAFKCKDYNHALVGRIAGYPVIKWCNTMGETSVFRGEDTQIKSSLTPTALLPQPIKFLLLSAPSRVGMHEQFKIELRLHNTTSYTWPLLLECANNVKTKHVPGAISSADDAETPEDTSSTNQISAISGMKGLYFTGVTSTNLGNINSNEFTDISIYLTAVAEGLHEIPPIFAIHTLTKEKYSSGKLTKVLVIDTATVNE